MSDRTNPRIRRQPLQIFRDLPIGRKLAVAIGLSTTAALVLTGVGVVAADSFLFREYLERDLSALAHIVSDNSTAAVAFDDSNAAGEMLSALTARPHVVEGCIYRANGTVLARYARPDAPQCPEAGQSPEVRFTNKNVTVSRVIMLNGRRIGTFVLLYDLGEIYQRMLLYGGTVAAVLLAASLIAFLLSTKLRQAIAMPVSELAHTAAQVSETRDYGIRAEKLSGDELGVLVDTFNEMLARIQSRDDELNLALGALEAALRDAQNTRDSLRTTLASIGDAVISTDVDGRVVFANRVARSLVGWRDEITGCPIQQIFRISGESNEPGSMGPVSRIVRDGATLDVSYDAVLIAQDGTNTPIDYSGAPIRADSGTILGAVLVFRDARVRRRAEETGRLLAAIVQSSDDAIIGEDAAGVITSWNKGAERIFGYSAEEMIGRPISTLSAEGQPDDTSLILGRIRSGEPVQQRNGVRSTKDGRTIHVSVTVSPLYNRAGLLVGASEIARDITEQVLAADRLAKLNEDLKRSNDNLARSNEDLERFAFVASHDLQEPLRMITVFSQLLIKRFPDPQGEAASFIANIEGGTRRMRELLADLLAYTELSARPEAPVQVVDFNAVMDKVRANLAVAIEDSSALITADPLPLVYGFEGHFVPLFQNLIANAIKYRSDKPPEIHVSFQTVGDELRFKVRDNGIGIAPEYHSKIFIPFKRLHGKNVPGTGLGLSICQRVVERYRGRIWVESEAGEGSAFQFSLPASMANIMKVGATHG